MLTVEVTICGALRLRKREQKLVLPKLDSKIIRMSFLLLRITGIVPKRNIENLKPQSRIRKSRYRIAKNASAV